MKYDLNRRRFFRQTLAGGIGGTLLTRSAKAGLVHEHLLHGSDAYTCASARITDDPRIKKMLQSGVDAAIKAGATYADMRFTFTRHRNIVVEGVGNDPLGQGLSGPKLRFDPQLTTDTEAIHVGVRAFVNGFWGFASGPVWTISEGERLGKDAALQAATNRSGSLRRNDFILPSIVDNGSWTTPIQIDPFNIHPSQAKDILRGISAYAVRRPNVWLAQIGGEFHMQDKAFCASTGSFFTQRTYAVHPRMSIGYMDPLLGGPIWLPIDVDWFLRSAQGFEVFDEARLRMIVDETIENYLKESRLPMVDISVGRYETVLDAASIAGMLEGSIGAATELDRALGAEANATGTSYLNDPITMLGTMQVGSPLINVKAERSMTKGLATVKWDDEGNVPRTADLIRNGILSDYQMDQNGVSWLKANKPDYNAISTGAARLPNAVYCPMTHTANLSLMPGAEQRDFNSLVRDIKKGIAVRGHKTIMDFQQLNGFTHGSVYQIENGKIVARGNLGIMFRSPELWKGIRAIGGRGSEQLSVATATKGEPDQDSHFTISAVPAMHESLTFVDTTRKA